ncbi:MAG: hypothetical protein O2798_04335 [Chloroflexi bacterium]|nr:hypothetical protein [Chloroflexota bacterium]MDA1240053.1 hypothetical protein [Chloroflexota bacterium]
MRRLAPLTIALAGLVLLLAMPAPGTAQEADGRLSGAVIMGTAGAALDESALSIRIVILEGEAVAGAVTADVVDGRYEARVPAILARTYVMIVTYRGIQYFVPPAILAPETPELEQDVTVYETTSERPDLVIEQTLMTLVAVDRDLGRMGFIREDLVTNPSDRVYVGDDRGVTLRIPAPEGTLEATGDNAEGAFTLEAGAVSAAVPFQPFTTTSVVTRYLVEYDVAEDAYLLRVTAPVTTGRIEARVPQGFLRGIDPQSPAESEGDVTVGEGATAAVLKVVAQGATEPGQSLLVRLDGISPTPNVNALTELPAAIIAALLAALGIGGAVAVAASRRPDPAA